MVAVQTSVTQLDKFQACPRDWWFDSIVRMPRGKRVYGMLFGDVLHGVLERYLKADYDGRGAELYPPGWQWAEGQRIEEEDDEVIQRLVELAIAEGYLVRLPGRQVERKFLGMMTVAPTTFGDHVAISGKIDLLDPPDSVVDHKGVKSMRYALSEEKLRDNNQLLLYAKVLADEHPDQQEFTLSHICYDRTKVRVDKRTVTVTRAEVEARWQQLVALAKDLQAFAAAHQETPEDQFHGVPGAMQGHGRGPSRCSDYGGCRFLDVCNNRESPAKFRRRHLRLANPNIQLPEEDPSMDLSAKLAALGGSVPVPTGTDPKPKVAGTSNVPVEELTVSEPPSREHIHSVMMARSEQIKAGADADWGECKACGGSGTNSKGGDCVCPIGTRQAQERTAAAKALEPEVAKKKRGRPKKEQVQVAQTIPETVVTATANDALQQRDKAFTEIEVVDGPKTWTVNLTTPGAPTILQGCFVTKGAQMLAYTLPEVLRIAVEEIAGNTLEEFYKADVWKRRDGLKSIGKQIAEKIGASYVLARRELDGDELALIAAISPYSSMEIGAVA